MKEKKLSMGRIGRLRGLIGSSLYHKSLPPEFESRRGHIRMVFHLWLRFITFGGRYGHLGYHVHKSGRKTLIFIITHEDNMAPNIRYHLFFSRQSSFSYSSNIKNRLLNSTLNIAATWLLESHSGNIWRKIVIFTLR